MTTAAARPAAPALPLRLIGFLKNLAVGVLMCLSPLTAVTDGMKVRVTEDEL